MSITKINTDVEILSCWDVMLVLRPHLKKDEFLAKVKRQYEQGYQIAAMMSDNQAVALIGYRILEFMAWGKILYIDDLITHPDQKRKGYGGQLLDWTFDVAKENNCDEVHLDTGHHRHDAHRLYLNKGFSINSHHLSKPVK